MTGRACERITDADLTGYSAGELAAADAAALEDHLFSCRDCGARAASFEALVGAIRLAMRSAEVGGFVTDALLNRLARDGVRVRAFTLAPGAIVPCAVWEDDELMVLRLRGDFGAARELTLSQRVAGAEVARTTGEYPAGPHGELLYAQPAAWVRQLPAVQVELRLDALEGGQERPLGRYTLVHGGAHRR